METTYYNSIGTSKQKYVEAITENEFGNVIAEFNL